MQSIHQQDGLESGSSSSSKKYVLSYVETLLELQLPEENRKLNEGEMVSLCSEFLHAGTDTTSTALQWIMANMVKYLKAVILEGLKRHPPGHFALPHSVTQDITFEGYVIPKNASVNFMVSEINWDPEIWEDPMEFKPERFLSSKDNGDDQVYDIDITGSRAIKMMPFGAGRRICPGYGLAMLHLEYFVANLVRSFEWKAVEGDEVDLSEKQEFTVVMKKPLQVHLSRRRK